AALAGVRARVAPAATLPVSLLYASVSEPAKAVVMRVPNATSGFARRVALCATTPFWYAGLPSYRLTPPPPPDQPASVLPAVPSVSVVPPTARMLTDTAGQYSPNAAPLSSVAATNVTPPCPAGVVR